MEDWKRKALARMGGGDLDAAIDEAAAKYGVPADLLRAQVMVESDGDMTAYNSEGDAHGPFQLTDSVMKQFGVTNPYEAHQAADAAAQYMAEGLHKYGGDTTKALMYYHGGPDESGWGEKTQQYPRSVAAAGAELDADLGIAQNDAGVDAAGDWRSRALARMADILPPTDTDAKKNTPGPTEAVAPEAAVPTSWPQMLANAAGHGISNLMDMIGPGPEGGFATIANPELAGTNFPLASQTMKSAGYQDWPGSTPQTLGQHAAFSATEGIVGGLPFGGASAPAILANAGGQMGADALGAISDENPLARLAGGVIGAVKGGKLASLPGTIANAVRGVSDNPVMVAAQRLGFQPRLKSTVQGREGLSQQVAEWMPVGPGRLRYGAQQEDEQLAEAAVGLAGRLSPVATLQQAGVRGQAEALAWQRQLPERLDGLWQPVDMAMSRRNVSPSNLRDAWENLLIRGGSFPRHVLGNVEAHLGAALDGPVSWQQTRQLEDWIGNARGVPQDARDLLLAGVRSDLGRSARMAGQGGHYTSAMNETSRLRAFNRDVASKLVSTFDDAAEKITPEAAATAMLRSAKAGGTTLAELRREIPAFANDLGAVKLRELAAPAKDIKTGKALVAPGILDRLDAREISPEGYDALFSPIRQDVDALRTLAGATAKTSGEYLGRDESIIHRTMRYGIPLGTYATGASVFGPAAAVLPFALGGATSLVAKPPLANPMFKYMTARPGEAESPWLRAARGAGQGILGD